MASFTPNKYVVMKNTDIAQLSPEDQLVLEGLLGRLKELRGRDGRNTDPHYLVCNRDEPYATDVLNTILLGEDRKKRKQADETVS